MGIIQNRSPAQRPADVQLSVAMSADNHVYRLPACLDNKPRLLLDFLRRHSHTNYLLENDILSHRNGFIGDGRIPTIYAQVFDATSCHKQVSEHACIDFEQVKELNRKTDVRGFLVIWLGADDDTYCQEGKHSERTRKYIMK